MMRKDIRIKKIGLFLFMMFTFVGYGQDNLKVNVPNFTPPSPEAFAITKYGDVPVDEFNGKVNLSIPVYEYQAGKLKLPISLNYNGAGVKVNDIPTQMGIGWLLNAGGLISREVRGIPDEMAQEDGHRITLTDLELAALNGPDCGSGATQLRAIIDGNHYDKEADIFHFNFQGQSGSFFFDNDYKPILSKNDSNLKIEVVGSLYTNKTFLITDESGVKYYFGGANASEDTSSRTVSNNGSWNLMGGGVTGFYLYKIEHPHNGTIFLEYDTATPYETTLSKSYSLTKQEELLGSTFCIERYRKPPSYGFSGFKTGILNKKEIKSIYSDNNAIKITFNRSAVDQIEFRTVLNNIEVKNGNVLLHKFNMHYTGLENPSEVKRFFLRKVELDKDLAGVPSAGRKHQEYVLEYNDPDALPIRFSKSQDILGFFNNKVFNTTLIPHFPEFYTFTGADRTANLTYSTKGALTKVIYPTGGYSVFEYEAQPMLEKTYESIGIQTNINLDNAEGIPPTVLFAEKQFMVSQNQTLNLILNVETIDNTNYETSYATAKLKIINITTGQSNNYGPVSISLVIPYEFVAGSTYKIEMELFPPQHRAPGYSAVGSLNFNLYNGFVKVEGMGVRLKRTKDYASLESSPITKRYYYTSFDKIGNLFYDNAFALQDSFKRTNSYSVLLCETSSWFFPEVIVITYVTLHSDNSFSDFSFNSSSLVDWANVTVSYGGDAFEQGGEEKTFLKNEKSSYMKFEPQSPTMLETGFYYSVPDAKSNVLSLDGLLVKSKIFKKINGNVFKIQEKTFGYSFGHGAVKSNVFGFKIYDPHTIYPGCNAGTMLSNYFIAGYNTYSYDFKKTFEKTATYIDPIPGNIVPHEVTETDDPSIIYPTQDQLEASYKKITTEQKYEYGAFKGLPTKITTKNSEGVDRSVVNTYVTPGGNLWPTLTQSETNAYAALYAQNNVASPIQVQQYEGNSTLLSTQRTLYKQDATRVLPALIKTAKGTQDLEERVVFEEYDTKGNPTLLSYAGGAKTKYLYNVNNQVIAKIENFTGTLNPNLKEILGNPCTFINQYPNSLVTLFTYDAITNLLFETIDSNCRKTTYVYDALHRLHQIKDHEGNVVKEFDTNYKPQ